MIILIRHAQSEGNKNRDIHQTTPDHRVKLTPEGHRQAREAGNRLRELLNPDDTLHFFTSPYRRTRETTEGILDSLTSDSPSPSPFPRHTIQVYEEPRLREQDFGNFQPCSTEMERMWMERADYGHFFYRIPNGESAADAYDRVSGFNESLWRLFGEEDFASVCVLVTHGLMTRVFLMKWYHWSVEYFEDLRNINHCEFVIMTHNQDNGKYSLQNTLRTWSALHKERDQEKDRERVAKGLGPAPITPTDHIPIRRKWGGCPDGCTHGLSADATRSIRQRLVDSVSHEAGSGRNKPGDQPAPGDNNIQSADKPSSDTLSSSQNMSNKDKSPQEILDSSRRAISNHTQHNAGLANEDKDVAQRDGTGDSSSDPRVHDNSHPKRPGLNGLHRDSEDYLIHPPPVSSSTACLKLALLHLGGRDGGGSMSGANSLAPSDDEYEDHDHRPHSRAASIGKPASSHQYSHSVSHSFEYPKRAPRPPLSQEFEDDGDDELSANPTEGFKRLRPHHHHNHNYHYHTHHRHTSSTASQHHHRMANILGDGDDLSTYSDSQTPPPSSESRLCVDKSDLENNNDGNNHEEELSLEAQQREDQSIEGSVY